jgi:riboflavin transporter FmnP
MGAKVKSHEAIRWLAMAAMLTAIAAVLQYMEISIPLMPSFVKLDLSDLPALIGSFSLGPWWGVLIQLMKNLLHLPFGSSAGVGELCNFLLGSVFVLVAGLVYGRRKSRKTALFGSVLGAVAMAIVSLPLNYYMVYPAYVAILHFPEENIIKAYEAIFGNVAHIPTANPLLNCLLIFNVTFTLAKGLLNMLLCFFIYKPLSKTVLSKELMTEEASPLSTADARKRQRNLWILIAVGILLLLMQAFLWAVKLFPETFAFCKPFVKMTEALNKALADPEKSWLLKALYLLAFHAVGVIGALCVALGAVNLGRVKKHQAKQPAEKNAPEDANSAE